MARGFEGMRGLYSGIHETRAGRRGKQVGVTLSSNFRYHDDQFTPSGPLPPLATAIVYVI